MVSIYFLEKGVILKINQRSTQSFSKFNGFDH